MLKLNEGNLSSNNITHLKVETFLFSRIICPKECILAL